MAVTWNKINFDQEVIGQGTCDGSEAMDKKAIGERVKGKMNLLLHNLVTNL